MNRTDRFWESLFDKYSIVDEVNSSGFFNITATQINEYREARLMTKFDHKSNLPKLFRDNNLSILPTYRGGYIIGDFESYCDFNSDDVDSIQYFEFPSFLESLDHQNITSESTAINCAFITKILHEFTKEEELYPTVSGRMSSSLFDFQINTTRGSHNISVENSQVEIDGGYEGSESLCLIEAKNSLADDFLIRQLYYPYQLWQNKISKSVRSIFLTYSNGIFHLREYAFLRPNEYNSIQLLQHKKYGIKNQEFNSETIEHISNTVDLVAEPDIPFPQADKFERVINLCELTNSTGNNFMSKEKITTNYDFNERQTDYYINAGKYLGLLKSNKHHGEFGCSLTPIGERIFVINIADRQTEFVKLILSHKVFNETLKLYFRSGIVPSKQDVVEIMKDSNLYKVNEETTYVRRSSTIIGWINWIIEQIDE